MRNRNGIVLILILLLVAVAIYIDLPISHPWARQLLVWQQPPEYRDLAIKLGLDLQGGTQVLLQADPGSGQQFTAGDLENAKTIVERRVNGLGVSEPLVQLQGSNRIIVELPGINNPDEAVKTIQSTGLLEFVDLGQMDAGTGRPQNWPDLTEGAYLRTDRSNKAPNLETREDLVDPYPGQVFITIMTGDQLSTATTQLDAYGAPSIGFTLKDAGAAVFAEWTSAHVGDILAIVLDNVIISAPRVQNAITSGSGEISGKFTKEEADNLSIQLRYGALPVPLTVVDRRTIGATLGGDSVRRSITAGIVGLLTVLIFMIAQYRVPGVLAAIALLIYTLLNLAVYKLVPVTLTLPGIAGFLLAIGMAVDANILIFERMKEELRWGRSLQYAVESAFHRAWPSVRDSNLSTLLSCGVLVVFGNTFGAQAVMGFAVNLAIGVVISMFTAVTVTRTLMNLLFHSRNIETFMQRRWLLAA